MKLPLISSIIALTVLISGQAFAAGLALAGGVNPHRAEPVFTFDNSECPIPAGRDAIASIFTTEAYDAELRALREFCDQLAAKSANKDRAQAFAAADTGGLFSYELCKQSPRELAASSESDREFNFVTAMCKRHDLNYGTARGLESLDPTIEATPSRFIRWTVIRSLSEGMPEECRYFYCDLEHYSSGKEHRNGWIITLPRNKGKPDDCKKHYCRSVDTESSTSEPINDNDSIKIGYEW